MSAFNSQISSPFGGGQTSPAYGESTGAYAGRAFLQRRLALWHNFEKIVGVPGDSDPSSFSQANMRLYTQASKDFMLVGTNAASSLCQFSADGGIVLTTNTTQNDQMIVVPLEINSSPQSSWGGVQWRTSRLFSFYAAIRTGAAITNTRLVVGMGLTRAATSFTEGSDDNFAAFVYDTSHGSAANSWHLFTSTGGSDVNEVATASFKATTVQASTEHVFRIDIGSNYQPFYYIDEQLVGIGPALPSGAVMSPIIGIQNRANDATDRSVALRAISLSQFAA